MNKKTATVVISVLLALIFGLLLFCFQVRKTEVALVTTFGKPTRTEQEPGLKFKLPWPIQSVQKFDNRVQNFESKFSETRTHDEPSKNILVMVYAGWKISDAAKFRASFAGSLEAARNALDGLIRTVKDQVVGGHLFSEFISADEKRLKFTEIEKEMLDTIRPATLDKYGIDVEFLGIKRLGLPDSVTEKVLERMKQERQRFVQKLRADGEAEASKIRSSAEANRGKLLADAQAAVIGIMGDAEAEAAKSYAVFDRNPDLAILILKLNALEASLKDKSTLILDHKTPPFDLLNIPKAAPAGSK